VRGTVVRVEVEHLPKPTGQTLIDIILAGLRSGELPSHLNAELSALALVGPVVFCRTMTPDPRLSSRRS
jgi:hypothetical protein